ncbi:MAG: PKD domain-containing protein [Crocinitomicaceae bacterium]|nr:PKD domain-containing protein [Crocinitomicaceae bacterium]
MLKIESFALFFLLLFPVATFSQWNISQSRILINNGSDVYLAGDQNPLSDASLDDYFLGRFSSGGTLTLKGGELRTYKDASSNVCETSSTAVFYRVYRMCDTPGSFTSIALPRTCAAPCPGTYDERYSVTSGTTNLLSGLTLSGTYVLEVYWQIEGNSSSSTGCGEYKKDDNSGDNFMAYFEFESSDSFSDGNFSSGPAWGGDTGNFTIVEKSDASTLSGSEDLNSHTLRLNASTAGTQYLSSQIADWESQQEWYFWVGRRGQSATDANKTYVWLYASESNLESATVDGYRIQIGDDSGDDEIRLERVDNGTPDVIFETEDIITNGITDWGVTFKITRDQDGLWTIRTSPLPTSSTDGLTALDCPESESTVLHSSTIDSEYFVEDNTYPPSSNGYFGVMAVHTDGSSTPLQGQEFDNFRVLTLPENTYINFTTTGATIDEDLSGGTYTLTIEITNPFPTVATTADVVLISGDDERVDSYTTQSITFPAGSSADKTVVLNITDNTDCDDIANLKFELQNISGGLNAYSVSPSVFDLNITDDEMGYETILSDDFEDGNINGWTAVSSGTWTANSTSPASGTYSLRHVSSGSPGQAYIYTDTDDAYMPGLTTTWRFNLKTYTIEPSPSTKFLCFIAANESDLWSTSVDGYALGVDPILSGDPDSLRLWRIENGATASVIATVPLDWGTSQSEVGFESTRDEDGLFTLKYDLDGDFDNLVSAGTGTDATYSDISYFGTRFIHTASTGGKYALDDVLITQKGCRGTIYSRSTGNTTDAIWSTAPSGPPSASTATLNRYTNLIIQNTHTVTLNAGAACEDITINSGGTFNNGTAKDLKVYGDWDNDGAFVKNTGTITMKGAVAQSIGGSVTTNFNHLVIDNDNGSVTLSTATEVSGVLRPEEATLTTGGNLTLISNTSGSGSIGAIRSGADISGNVLLQRYLPGSLQNWVFLGCPITGRTIADWNDDILTTGFTGADFPVNSLNNIQHYDETQTGGRNVGWVGATNVTNSLSSANGYIVYMTAPANTVDVTGTIQKGDVAVPLSYTVTPNSGDGWNLVTNVYPSEVDWEAVEGNSSNVATYYVFDSQLPGYRSYNANTQVGSASRFIAHSQSFFVQATAGSQNLNFKETHNSETGSSFVRNGPDAQLIRLRIEKDNQADEAVIAFVDGATDNYEHEYDAEKFESMVTTSPEFALVSADNKLMTIDARPSLSNELSIPVYLDLPTAGTYTFIITDVLNIAPGSCITVEDTSNGTVVPVETGTELSVVAAGPYQGNRMIIHFSAPVSVITSDATCYGSDNGSVDITLPEGNWNYSIINGLGATVFSGTTSSVWSNAPAGSYVVEMTNADNSCGVSSADIKIEEPSQIESSLVTSVAHCNTANDGRIEIFTSAGSDYPYTITNYSGETVAQGQTVENTAVIENLPADVYTVSVETICADITQVADIKDPAAVNAGILASATDIQIVEGTSGDITFSADAGSASSYIWTINGTVVSNDISFTHTFDNEGSYTVQLTASNTSCSDSEEITIAVEEVLSIAESGNRPAVTMLQMNGGIQLTFVDANAKTADIRLFGTNGQLVKRERSSAHDGQRVFIDLNDLSKGVYTVQVVSGQTLLMTQKVVR